MYWSLDDDESKAPSFSVAGIGSGGKMLQYNMTVTAFQLILSRSFGENFE